MRALVIALALLGCKSEKSADEWKPVPPDRSLEFHGNILDAFCQAQEREPGWTCDDYENCETGLIDGLSVCRAKQSPGA